MPKIIRISSFGLGSLFIIEYSDRHKRRVTEDEPRTIAATKRLIAGGGFKHAMSLGGYDLYELPVRR